MHNEVLGNRVEYETGENIFDEFNKDRQEINSGTVASKEDINEQFVAPVLPTGEMNAGSGAGVAVPSKKYENGGGEDVVLQLMGSMKNDPAGFNDEINNICNEMNGGDEH